MVKNFKIIVLLAVLAAFASVSTALADSIYIDPATDVEFTATVTGTLVTLDVQCLNTKTCGALYLGDVSLKGFTFTGTPTLGSGSAPGYTLVNGGQNNSGVGGGGGCNDSDLGGAVCWDTTGPTLTLQLGNTQHTFTANITGGSVQDLAVMATGYTNDTGSQTGGGKPLAVSSNLTVPEPNTAVLLVIGLFCVFAFRVRFAATAAWQIVEAPFRFPDRALGNHGCASLSGHVPCPCPKN